MADAGVYILETLNTNDLAADGVHEFFFVLGQPRFAGSVQAVINPVAIRWIARQPRPLEKLPLGKASKDSQAKEGEKAHAVSDHRHEH